MPLLSRLNIQILHEHTRITLMKLHVLHWNGATKIVPQSIIMAMCQISCWTLRHNDPQVKNNQESIQIYTTQINTCDLIYDHQLFKKTVQISHTCSNFLSVHNCNVFVSSFSLHNVSLYLVTVKQRARRLPVANIINKVPVICAREKKT